MKYIVCNSENAVFNRMYDELEKFIEEGAVISLSEKVIGTQFAKRMIDEKNNGKYKYNHIIFLGQKELINVDLEEDFSLYRTMRKNLYSPLDADYKNIYYPSYFNEEDIEKYETVIAENPLDVAILFLEKDGTIFSYSEVTEDNKKVHVHDLSSSEQQYIRDKFNLNADDNKVIHFGLENILSSRNIFLVVLGEDKKQYIKNLLEQDGNENSFMTALKNHRNLTIFVDKEASYKSEEEANKLIRENQRKKEIEELRKVEQELKVENE